jgi:hypothetical protein
MSLNICIDCKFEKKKCQCTAKENKTPEVKMTWWRKIIYYLIG